MIAHAKDLPQTRDGHISCAYVILSLVSFFSLTHVSVGKCNLCILKYTSGPETGIFHLVMSKLRCITL